MKNKKFLLLCFLASVMIVAGGLWQIADEKLNPETKTTRPAFWLSLSGVVVLGGAMFSSIIYKLR